MTRNPDPQSPAGLLEAGLDRLWGPADGLGLRAASLGGVPVGRITGHPVEDWGWFMEQITMDQRRQGHGSAVMRQIMILADEAGAALCLEAFVRPDLEGGGPLIGWYRSLGFELAEEADDQGYAVLRRAPPVAEKTPEPE